MRCCIESERDGESRRRVENGARSGKDKDNDKVEQGDEEEEEEEEEEKKEEEIEEEEKPRNEMKSDCTPAHSACPLQLLLSGSCVLSSDSCHGLLPSVSISFLLRVKSHSSSIGSGAFEGDHVQATRRRRNRLSFSSVD
ncbi:hypothetical protein V1478_010973 [Vespula squamosa]|uniref:Uncharacterized protein n=1 Tax=Vespula squamosa TaxID=30214 RepID=A0ABD2AGH9_VESSQ